MNGFPTPRSRLLLALAVAVVLAAGGWLLRGRVPPAVAPAPAGGSAAPVALSASQVEQSVERAREAVGRDPEDAAAWAMLAHSSTMLGNFEQAKQAYARLLELRPQDAAVHADAAESLAAARGGRLQGEPAALAAQALALDAGNLKALGLAGKAAFESRDYAQAVRYWERALGAAQDPAVRHQLELNIAEARSLAAPAATASTPQRLAFVAGRVTVADALKSRIAPDDAVFIYARPVQGSRMPVALLRRRGSDLPLDFALDDTLAMVPQARLSLNERVFVGVRVSRRGDAIATAGDLRGEIGPVALGSTGLKLEVNDVVK